MRLKTSPETFKPQKRLGSLLQVSSPFAKSAPFPYRKLGAEPFSNPILVIFGCKEDDKDEK